MANNSIVVRPIGAMVAALSRYGQQLYRPPSDTIRGVEPDTWYSPLQPVQPIAPDGTEPRAFQYWAGQNLLWTPRADAEYTAADLKQLAQYPLARICIENVKDLVSDAEWEIQLKPKPGEKKKELADRAKGDAVLLKLSRFFENPDREHNWADWLRPLLDDLLVIDAASILIRKTFSGEVVELPVLRGDSIVRYIDVNGFTPMPPQPAYAQNWWGIPLVNLDTNQLVYKPRNIVPRNTVSSQLYGMSPTEQLATEIKIGMQRLQFTLDYYTEGSIPGVIQVVPKGTPPEKISEAMQWMNSELAGNLAARRQWRMVQGFQLDGKPDQIEFTKEPLLADIFDEMHIRKICFGYGTSPQRLMKMMNRASSQQMDESADIEGLRPWVKWLKGVMDQIIQKQMGLTDYEMVFTLFKEPDQEKEANTVGVLVGKAIITPNEGRERIGEEARNEPEADQLGVITGTGFVPIGMAAAMAGSETDASGSTIVKDQPAKPGDKKNGKDGKNGGTSTTVSDKGADKGSSAADGGGDGQEAGGRGKSVSSTGTRANGHGLTKGHCGLHDAYAEHCIDCSQQEIRRLEKQVPPVTAASIARAIAEGAVVSNPKGPIGFAASATANQPAPVRGWLHTIDADLEKQHKYASTQINLPPVAAEQVLAGGRDLIPDADLMSHGRELHPHITVRYGVVDDADKLRDILEDFKPFEVALGLVHVFPVSEHSEGSCPVVIDVDSPELIRLNVAIDAAMSAKVNDFEYHPHCTLAYVKSEVVEQYRGSAQFQGIKFTVESVALCGKEDDAITECPLTKLSKFHHPHHKPRAIIHPGHLTPQSHLAIHDLVRVLHNKFVTMRQIVHEELTASLVKLSKSDDGGDSQSEVLRRILARLAPEWLSLPDELSSAYESAALSGAVEGALQIDVTDSTMLSTINSVARDWASSRAAELVGMRRDKDNANILVPNPDAKWAISESTRDKLRSVVASAFETEAPTSGQLDMLIQGAGIFDDSRATMIARSEIARAQSVGNLTAWSESGLINTVEWEISGDHDHDDECDENEGNSPYSIDDVPDHPAHPNCLLPNTCVSASAIAGATKRRFEGKVITISAQGIDELTVTPNHPILTGRGLIPARLIKQDDYLFSCHDPRAWMSVISPDDYHVESRIEQIFDSLLESCGMTSVCVPTAPEDFHGDGISNTDVDVVRADSLLQYDWEWGQRRRQFQFVLGRMLNSVAFDAKGVLSFVTGTQFGPAPHFSHRGSTVLPLLERDAVHVDCVGLRVGSNSKSQFLKSGSQSATVYARLFSQYCAWLASFVRLIKVNNVSFSQFSGHVYNLQTDIGYYAANSIITHNCECVLVASDIEAEA